jgi:hypothetical protein
VLTGVNITLCGVVHNTSFFISTQSVCHTKWRLRSRIVFLPGVARPLRVCDL